MNNRYGRLAALVYDLDKPVGRVFGKEIEFYRSRLSECRGRILEPGVGTGRLLIPLLEAGLPVEGFDASEDMLERCRTSCRKHGLSPRLELMRFQDFAYEYKFDAIIMPLGTFQLIGDFAEALLVLRRFHDHLLPGGRLIVDLDPLSDFFGDSAGVRSWPTEDGDLITLQAQQASIDHVAQRKVSHLRYERWRDSRLIETQLEVFTLRWWGVNEFALVLKAAGFGDIVISGSHEHGRVPTCEDWMITFEGQRS
ncbi:class I SAM-dependent methyltransferase [Azospirillum soli]|uniref:class I SAM-dependent methyltransferase n=1 Tax=Azospirillum soli TaxID=1304799 RepID=UPI001AE31B28|nr:class I SAM-dependent methyltransferase [Azospirillum soli]MBP2316172.1 SAM-dependent methyltransferase [Azospirillum soli]